VQVHFGSSFAAAVFSLVEGVSNERDGAGINCRYGLGKSTRQSLIANAQVLRRFRLEVAHGFAEERFHHIAIAGFVRV